MISKALVLMKALSRAILGKGSYKWLFQEPQRGSWGYCANRVELAGTFLFYCAVAVVAVLLGPLSFFGEFLRRSYANSMSRISCCLYSFKRGSKKPLIVSIPGCYLYSFARFLYSPATVTKIFLPVIADLQHEYIEALAKGEKWKARWVRVRGYWGFWKAVGLQTVIGQVLSKIFGPWKIN